MRIWKFSIWNFPNFQIWLIAIINSANFPMIQIQNWGVGGGSTQADPSYRGVKLPRTKGSRVNDTYIYIYIYVIHIHTHIYICRHVIYIYIYIYIAYVNIDMYMYVCVYMYIYTHTPIHIRILDPEFLLAWNRTTWILTTRIGPAGEAQGCGGPRGTTVSSRSKRFRISEGLTQS